MSEDTNAGAPASGRAAAPSDAEVDHPSHYNHGKIEAIDVIEDAGLGPEFCLGNALKYLLRAPHKGSYLQDLKKARWYINRLIQREEKP